MPPSPLLPPVPEISVVIPFFNEGPNVAPLLEEVRLALEPLGQPYEVLCVDDGSEDETALELQRVRAGWPACRVMPLPQNRGQAAALWLGLKAAAGTLIITMDGDGQNDPSDIPRLLQLLRSGTADMVVGVRAHRQDSSLRKGMSRLANGVRARILRDGVSDSGCALKAFRSEVAASFLPIRTLYSFMPALAVAAGFTVRQAPVGHRPRVAGTSKYGLAAMWLRPTVDMLGIWWFARRRFPERPAAPALNVVAPTSVISPPGLAVTT